MLTSFLFLSIGKQFKLKTNKQKTFVGQIKHTCRTHLAPWQPAGELSFTAAVLKLFGLRTFYILKNFVKDTKELLLMCIISIDICLIF